MPARVLSPRPPSPLPRPAPTTAPAPASTHACVDSQGPMSSLTVPIPPDLSPACRAGNTDPGTVPRVTPVRVPTVPADVIGPVLRVIGGGSRVIERASRVIRQASPVIGEASRVIGGASPPAAGMRKGPGRTIRFSTGAFPNVSSAVSYSPTTLRLQYHRRYQA